MPNVTVVGVDAHEPSQDAVALGAALATATQAELLLVHAHPYDARSYETLARGLPPAGPVVDEARELLARAAAAAPIKARMLAVAASSPVHGLHAVAERERARVIVVGSTHRGALGRVMLGSNSERVLHGAPCAVAVAPRGLNGRSWTLRTIAVGFDGSREAHHALTCAQTLAKTSGARLRLIAVAPGPLDERVSYRDQPDWRQVQRRRHDARERELAAIDEDADAEIFLGDAVEQLQAISRRTDLLVLGSRGYGPIRRVLLGATAHRVVREAACPVIVVPRSAHEDSTDAPVETTADASPT